MQKKIGTFGFGELSATPSLMQMTASQPTKPLSFKTFFSRGFLVSFSSEWKLLDSGMKGQIRVRVWKVPKFVSGRPNPLNRLTVSKLSW